MTLRKRSRVEGNTVPPRFEERPRTLADGLIDSDRTTPEARKTLFAMSERHVAAKRAARDRAKQTA